MDGLLEMIKDMVVEDLKKPFGEPIKEELIDQIAEPIKSLSDTEDVDRTKPVKDMLNACKTKGDILGVGICLKLSLNGMDTRLYMSGSSLLNVLLLANENGIKTDGNVKSMIKKDIKKAFDVLYKDIETAIDNYKRGID